MSDCLFCKIIAGEIPSEVVFQDEQITAFRDINPVAPTHILIIPNKHIATINDLTTDDVSLIGHLFTTAKALAKNEGIDESGYRLIINVNRDGGQEIYHLHLHLIGGQKMRYPMG